MQRFCWRLKMTPAKTSRHRHRSGLGSYFSGSRGSRSRLQLLAAPAGVNGSVMSRLFVAPMELVIWEAFGNTAAIRRPPIGSPLGWHQPTPFRHACTRSLPLRPARVHDLAH